MGNLIKILIGAGSNLSLAWSVAQVIFGTIRRIKKMSDENNGAGFDAKSAADKVIEEAKGVFGEIKEMKGAKVSEVIKNVPHIVESVERLAKSVPMTGEQKRDVAVEIINRFIDIPLIPESGEAILIGFVIDAVVAAFNKYGKDWISKL